MPYTWLFVWRDNLSQCLELSSWSCCGCWYSVSDKKGSFGVLRSFVELADWATVSILSGRTEQCKSDLLSSSPQLFQATAQYSNKGYTIVNVLVGLFKRGSVRLRHIFLIELIRISQDNFGSIRTPRYSNSPPLARVRSKT